MAKQDKDETKQRAGSKCAPTLFSSVVVAAPWTDSDESKQTESFDSEYLVYLLTATQRFNGTPEGMVEFQFRPSLANMISSY